MEASKAAVQQAAPQRAATLPIPARSHLRQREAPCSRGPHAQQPQQQQQQQAGPLPRLPAAVLAGLVSLTASASLLLGAPQPVLAEDVEPATTASSLPFLKSQGATGILADEEARLFRLRQAAETEARKDLQVVREALEGEARGSAAGKLCATPLGVDVVGITEAIALTGALVGGFSARQRKAEVERLNDQLRRINLSLRQQARAGTVFSPGLNYAPNALPRYRNGAPLSPGDAAEGELAAIADSPAASSRGGTATLERPPQGAAVATPPAPNAPERAASSSSSSSGAAVATPPLDSAPGPAISAPLPLQPPSLLSVDEEELTAEERACMAALREGKR